MKELERKTRICVCWREGREGLGCAIGLGCLDSCYTEVAERERLQQAEWRLDRSGTWKVEMEGYRPWSEPQNITLLSSGLEYTN